MCGWLSVGTGRPLSGRLLFSERMSGSGSGQLPSITAVIEDTRAALCAEIAAGNLVALGRPGIMAGEGDLHPDFPRRSLGFSSRIPKSTILAGWATCGGAWTRLG